MSDAITSGRALRMFKVGSLTTQIGSSYLWNAVLKPFRTVDDHEREVLEMHVNNALRIVERSQELRGAFTKLAQMLSTRDDLLPPQALEILSVVQSSVPAMDWSLIRKQIRSELGQPPEKLFRRFEREAFAAASLGQVHRAELPDGTPVVVKVQYPGVEETVEQDLDNIRALLEIVARIGRDVMRQKIDVAEVEAELRDRLREELDYEREAENVRLFRDLFEGDESLEIPEVVPGRSGRRVLTMTFVEGYPLADMLNEGVEQDLRDWIAETYARTVLRQILRHGVVHTDPHPGNYLVTWHPRLGILDFGSVRVLGDELRRSYVDLAGALLDDDAPRMIAASRALGFLGEEESGDALVSILRSFFEPILEDGELDPAGYDTLDKALTAAQTAIENRLFRAPGHRVFLGRALMGLETYVRQLGARKNWRRIFAEEIAAAH